MARPDGSGFWEWVIYLISNNYMDFLTGAGRTLLLAAVGTLIGCLIGFLVGIVQTIPIEPRDSFLKKAGLKTVRFLLMTYVEVFRGTPMIIQAVVIYYGAMFVGIDMTPLFAGFFIVSINTGAYMSESVRGGIDSIDKGQFEAAKAIGMTHFQAMVTTILPQALRNILPQIGNNLIINIKDTAVLNIITVPELFFAAKTLTGSYYQYFQTYFIDCAVYFILTFTCSRLLRMYERKLDGPDSYNLAGTGGKPAPGKRPTGVTMQLMSGRLREQRSAMR